jgi:hypothetical protein
MEASECGSIFNRLNHGVSYLAHIGRPAPNYVAGPVIATATHVSLTFKDGTHLRLPTILPPRGLAPNIRFFIDFMPCRTSDPVRIVGTDANQRIVASLQLPSWKQPRETC